MSDRLSSLLGVPRAAVIVIGVIAVVQIVLQVYSLVDLARRSAVKGGRKWIWALVIVLGQILGSILYLAVGRPTEAAVESTGDAANGRAAAERAADTLYGPGRPS